MKRVLRSIKDWTFSFLFLFFCLFPAFSQSDLIMDDSINDQTFNICDASIQDSGGDDLLGYSNNEDVTVTICPDLDSTKIILQWIQFDLNTLDDNPDPNEENIDYMFIWDGDNTNGAPSLGYYTSNELFGESIGATDFNTSGCLSLKFVSNSIGTGQFEALIHCFDLHNLPVVHAEILNSSTSTGDSTFVCSGTEVSLFGFTDVGEENSLSSLIWLIDNSLEIEVNNYDTLSYIFNLPGIHNVKYIATDAYGNTVIEELGVFVYPIEDLSTFPYDTTVCISDGSFYLSVDPLDFTSNWGPNKHLTCLPYNCLDDDVAGLKEFPLFVNGFQAGETIDELSDIESICVDIEHSFIGDFVLEVQCPNGQIMTLHEQGGGATAIGIPMESPDEIDCDDLSTYGEAWTYCFTPTATQTWMEASTGVNTLPAGDYEPIDSFDELLGCPINGVWSLLYIDFTETNDGSMPCWSILFDSSLPNSNSNFEVNTTVGVNADSSYWNPDGEYIIEITPNGNEILIDPETTGEFEYTYSIINSLGCSNTLTSVVNIIDADCEVWLDIEEGVETKIELPQVFSPNGDGVNDFFGLSSDEISEKDFSMWIYDLLGNLVFASSNPDEKWGGTHFSNSSTLPMGVYVYKIQYRFKSESSLNGLNGKLLLTR